VAFQLVIETSAPVKEVNLDSFELAHPSGVKLTGKNLQVFKEWYVRVRRPTTGYEGTSLGPAWYPDALMPARRARLGTGFPFSIPDLYNNIPGQRNHALWFDIHVPYDREKAPPGRYSGTLAVRWDGGEDSVAVALDVWDFALPHESHLKGDIWNGSMRHMPPEEELLYYQMARRHRFHPLIYAYRPELSVSGTEVKLDWTAYHQRA
ncbi:MAG: hypothetical protein GY953_34890, partial [bacterium]|nr:hypothetical protein [bacterium]